MGLLQILKSKSTVLTFLLVGFTSETSARTPSRGPEAPRGDAPRPDAPKFDAPKSGSSTDTSGPAGMSQQGLDAAVQNAADPMQQFRNQTQNQHSVAPTTVSGEATAPKMGKQPMVDLLGDSPLVQQAVSNLQRSNSYPRADQWSTFKVFFEKLKKEHPESYKIFVEQASKDADFADAVMDSVANGWKKDGFTGDPAKLAGEIKNFTPDSYKKLVRMEEQLRQNIKAQGPAAHIKKLEAINAQLERELNAFKGDKNSEAYKNMEANFRQYRSAIETLKTVKVDAKGNVLAIHQAKYDSLVDTAVMEAYLRDPAFANKLSKEELEYFLAVCRTA